MTVLDPHLDDPRTDPAEALIPEARELQHRRWRRRGLMALLALTAGAGGDFALLGGGGRAASVASASSAPGYGSRIPAWAAHGFIVYRCEGGTLCIRRPGAKRGHLLDPKGPSPQWDPAISPTDQTVAFRGYWGIADGAYALYLTSANGCTTRRITHSIASTPSWAPNGRSLVFDGGDGIWKVHANGTGLTRLTAATRQASSPAWSPTNTEIAFMRYAHGRGQIWVMNTSGTRAIMLRASTSDSYEQPSWSRDGRQIAFIARASGRSWIDVMNADGSQLHAITPRSSDASNPVWLPNDTGIAWLANGGSIYASRPNGTHQIRVLHAHAEQFTWSSGSSLPLNRC